MVGQLRITRARGELLGIKSVRMGFLAKLLKNAVERQQTKDKNRKSSRKKKQTAETLSQLKEEYPSMKYSESSSSPSLTASGYSVSDFLHDIEENNQIHVAENTIRSNFEKKTSTPLNLKIEPLNKMTRRKSTPVMDVFGVQVYEDDTETDDDHEDDVDKDEKVVTGRMMFISYAKSDLYENTKFFKGFTSNDATEDGYEVVIDNCRRRNQNRLIRHY